MNDPYEYNGHTPVQVGDRIELFNGDATVKARVHVALATQFIADRSINGQCFYAYADKGVTWQQPKVKDKE